MPDTTPPDKPGFTASGSPTLQQLVDYLVESLYDPRKLERLSNAQSNAIARGEAVAQASRVASADELGGTASKVLEGLQRAGGWVAAYFASLAIENAFDIDIANVEFAKLGASGERNRVAAVLTEKIIESLTGGSKSIEASPAPAAAYVNTVLHIQIETWMIGLIAEVLSGFAPQFEQVQLAGEIGNRITAAFGIGDSSSRVLRPYIDNLVVEPLRRYIDKTYRPMLVGPDKAIAMIDQGAWDYTRMHEELALQGYSDEKIRFLFKDSRKLLQPAAAAEVFLRGDWTEPQLIEELTRQGWDAERIEILVKNARRRLSLEQLMFLHYRGQLDQGQVISGIRALGYDTLTAGVLFSIATQQRTERWREASVDAAVTAYVDRVIDDKALEDNVRANVAIREEATFILLTAQLRRQYRTKRLAAHQVRELVKDGLQEPADYRRALARDGWNEEAQLLLELQLRVELQQERDVAKARAEQAAERAAEKAERLAAKQQRQTELAERQAREAFPSLSEYRTAYVHGAIPREVYVAALAREHIVEDLDVILLETDADREQHLADLERRAALESRITAPGLSIAALEQTVLDDILGLGEFDARLAQRGYADGDRRLLTALLTIRLAARDEARQKRAAAAATAAGAGVSLDAWERAVRLGVRTRAQYAAYLDSLGTTDLAKRLILDLLDASLAQDATTRATRAAREEAAMQQGISLAQRRRAVIAGVRPIASYEDALRAAGWPVDDQLLELDLVRVELAAAAEARARRDAIAPAAAGRTLSLGQLERAFTLSFLDGAEFRDALRALGYDAGDVELIVALNVAALPDVRAGQRQRDVVRRELAEKGVSLADLERLVKRGIRTPADYGADLLARGYGVDAVDLLVQLIAEEVAIDVDGLRAKIAAALATVDAAPTLDELVEAFRQHAIDVVDLQDMLVSLDVPRDAALVFSRLVGTRAIEG